MIPQTPEERRVLIGEYILGLLDATQAEDVRLLIENDEEAARLALEWERHFLELSDQLPPQPPSAKVWPRVQQTLGLSLAESSSTIWRLWWNNLLTWRLSTAALALALIVALVPGVWRPVAEASRYTAVLQAPGESAKPGWVVHIDTQGALHLEPLLQDQVPADRAVQFWTLVDPATGPRSLGLVEPGQGLKLLPEQIGRVQPGQLFELTLEPAGGSPYDRPTGKVLYIGRAVVASAN